MIEDLQGSGQKLIEADVVVVGGGTAGLVIATELARAGRTVICLESGGLKQIADEHPLNEVVHTKQKYSGAAHGRFRCIGGTSTRWGGALIPFLSRDIEDAHWPISLAEILKYRSDVETLFGLVDGQYEQDIPGQKNIERSHIARAAKWPAFKRRNVFHLLENQVRAESGPRVILNATVTNFRNDGPRLTQIIAHAPDRSTVTVQASEFIVAAGAIETTRLLLLLDRETNGLLSRESDQLGRYFYDHLSAMFGTLDVIDRNALNRLVGFRFEPNGTLRNIRFEFSENSIFRQTIPPCFAHIAFEEDPTSGFHALRDMLRHVQQGRMPSKSTFFQLARSTPWLVRVAWWRFFERRLLYPNKAKLQVHLVIEQTPKPDNRITLSPDRVDVFGNPLAQVEWSVEADDFRNFERAIDAFECFWKSSGYSAIATINRRDKNDIETSVISGGGIYHPGGSTRMARSPVTGVVDPHLKVFGCSNLWAVSTSVFPTGGGSNPTMMLMMLALRCAEDVAIKLSTKGTDD